MDKRTAITYIDPDGNWHRASKGAPEQVFIQSKKSIDYFMSPYCYLPHDILVQSLLLKLRPSVAEK